MKRLDAVLVEFKLAPSRTKAQAMIKSGEVQVFIAGRRSEGLSNGNGGGPGEWKTITQSSYSLKDWRPECLRLAPDSRTLKYVSRGGLKLEGALRQLALDVRDWRVLDVGISTGGFSDCLLQAGCREVLGVDVGHAQLDERLSTDSRVKHFEGVNIRDLSPAVRIEIARGIDLCVVDVSFISLKLVIPVLGNVLPPSVRLLALVKPQFEVGPKNLDKNGVVQDGKLFLEVQTEILRTLEKCGFSLLEYFPSELRGQDGNQEFFLYAQRP